MACYEAAEKQASALARELDAAGWQLVPREPTQEMYAAGDTAFEGGYVREVYRDMLAAAPQSPLAPQSEP